MHQLNVAIGDHASVNVNPGTFMFLLSRFQILGLRAFRVRKDSVFNRRFEFNLCFKQIMFSALHKFLV